MKHRKFTLFYATIMLLLCHFTLQAQYIISGNVLDEKTKEPLVAATVYAKGTTVGVVTNIEGKFYITVPNGTNTIVVSYVGYSSKEVPVSPGMGDVIVNLEEGVELENVVVIGSRNQTRTKLETAVPVDVIPIAQVINEVGQVEVNQILTYLAPSFQSSRQTIADGTDHVDPASLRGLGPDQVLVLVNGKRRHQSALVNVNGTVNRGTVGTDMSSIPATAIERIEILRDGAAAQYGSDAIAGVINIVLKQETERGQFGTMYGIHAAGDGQMVQASTNYGFKLAEKGFVNVTGEFSDRGFTDRSDEFKGTIYSDAYLKNPKTNPEGAVNQDELLAKRGLTRDDFSLRAGNSAIRSSGVMFNAKYPLTFNNAEIYAFGGYNFKNGRAAGFYRMPGDNRNVTDIYLNGFLPEIHTAIEDRSMVTGVRGQINGWNLDLSHNVGQNGFRYRVENSLNASALAASQTSFDAGGFAYKQNVMNFDASKPFKLFERANVAFGAEFRTENYKINRGEEASYKNYGLKTISTPDTFINSAGKKVPYISTKTVDVLGKPGGAQVFPGFRPENETNQTRTASSAYIDLEADLTNALMVATALRYENYSDFGQTLNYKVASRYRFNEKVSVRAATSTGFRAPSQQQKYFNATSTLFIDGTPFEVGTFPNESRAAQLLGIPKLKQETNVNYSAGFTFRPSTNLELTIDAYQIDIKDRIILTGQFGDATSPLLNQEQKDRQKVIAGELIGANVQRAAFFTNAVDTRTRGVDVVASYTLPFAKNHYLRFIFAGNLAYNRLKKDDNGKVNYDKGTPILNTTDKLRGLEPIYFNREDQSRLEVANPREKGNLTIQYANNKLNVMLRNAYWGQVIYLHPNDAIEANWVANTFANNAKQSRDQTFAPRVITDLTIGYQMSKNLNFSVGANNLLNVYPDKHTHSNNYDNGNFPYSRRVTQFGFNGAFYFARLRYNLRGQN
jgi:iron complex outermembrane recepter protein